MAGVTGIMTGIFDWYYGVAFKLVLFPLRVHSGTDTLR